MSHGQDSLEGDYTGVHGIVVKGLLGSILGAHIGSICSEG